MSTKFYTAPENPVGYITNVASLHSLIRHIENLSFASTALIQYFCTDSEKVSYLLRKIRLIQNSRKFPKKVTNTMSFEHSVKSS